MKNRKNLFILIIFIIIIIAIIFISKTFNKYNKKYAESANNLNSIIENKENNGNEENNETKAILPEEIEFIKAEYVKEKSNGTLENNREELKKTKEIDGVEYTILSITGTKEKISIKIQIKNISSTTNGNKNISIIFYDKDGKETGKIETYLKELQKEQSITLQSEIGGYDEKTETYINVTGFINAYDYTVK